MILTQIERLALSQISLWKGTLIKKGQKDSQTNLNFEFNSKHSKLPTHSQITMITIKSIQTHLALLYILNTQILF